MKQIRVAMSKGNTLVSTLFRNAGYSLPHDFDDSRKYIVPIGSDIEFILAKPIDIPTYVEYGVADIGIVGKEILLEENRNVYELMKLPISSGYLSKIKISNKELFNPRVATLYPNISSKYFREKGQQAEIIRLNGRLELALFTGLADCIIDVVEINGQKKFEHFEVENICNVSSRLIANKVSYQIKDIYIQEICDRLDLVFN